MNFFEKYFEFVAGGECPNVYHRWAAITGVGALLGRQFYIPHGHNIHYPTMYTFLIGTPGTRKSTSIKIMRELLRSADYTTFSANKSSREQFLEDLFDGDAKVAQLVGNSFEAMFGGDDTLPREMFIAADEMRDYMGAGNLDFAILLGTLWEGLPHYDNRLKNSRSVLIPQPTITILSGNTPETFVETFPVGIIGQGFLSRLLLIYGEASGVRVAWPEEANQTLREELIADLRKIKSSIRGAANVTPEAKAALTEIYNSWVDLEDLRLHHYSTRRHTHLLKLMLIIAATNFSTTVDLATVILSNSILSFAESRMHKALGEFGQSKHSDVAQKLMAALYEATQPLSQQALWKLVLHDLEKPADLANLLQNLLLADKIFATETASGKHGYLAKSRPKAKSNKYVDYSLLIEAR